MDEKFTELFNFFCPVVEEQKPEKVVLTLLKNAQWMKKFT